MQALKVTFSSARASRTMAASRMPWKGRASESRSDRTLSVIQRRVVWDIVGLLGGGAWVVKPPTLVPGRPTSVYLLPPDRVTKIPVPFVSLLSLAGSSLHRLRPA